METNSKEYRASKSREWRSKNPETTRSQRASEFVRNNQKLRARKSHLMISYGLSLADYEMMVEHQKGVCAVCHQPELRHNGNLVVDHDHNTGKVRGLLCHKCNSALGLLDDDHKRIVQLAQYLEGII